MPHPCLEAARIAKHDLGKYVTFQTRWLGADASEEERLDALRADLLETRRGPDGTVDALAVWAEFRPILHGEQALPGAGRIDLRALPEVRALGDAMRALEPVVRALRGGSAGAGALQGGTEGARVVAMSCQELQRRVWRAMGS